MSGTSRPPTRPSRAADTTAPVISGVGGGDHPVRPTSPNGTCDRDGQLRRDPDLTFADDGALLPAGLPCAPHLDMTDKCAQLPHRQQAVRAGHRPGDLRRQRPGDHPVRRHRLLLADRDRQHDATPTLMTFAGGGCPAPAAGLRAHPHLDRDRQCGNSRTASQAITVQDTTAPVISGVGGPATIQCDRPSLFSPTATDNCDATPT
ncbi:MAG: hypothetical protein U1F77_03480 [Kiritimatiellia bacterium]